MFEPNLYIQSFLAYCENRKGLNEKTIKAYKTDLQQFAEYSCNKLSKEAICLYIDDLHQRFKPKTAKRKIASIKAFVRFLLVEEIIEINPFDKIITSFREPMAKQKEILMTKHPRNRINI